MIRLLIFLLFTTFSLQAQETKSMLAAQYFQKGEYAKASELYEELFSKQTGNTVYYKNYVTCLVNLKEFEKAQKVVKKQIRRMPEALNYRVDLGMIFLAQEIMDKANKEFDNALKELKPNPVQIALLGDAFMKVEQYEYALRAYLRGRELLNDKSAFISEISRIYSMKQDKANLIEELLSYLEIDNGLLSQVQSNLQDFLTEDKDYAMLRSAILKRTQKYPDRTVYTELLIWQFIQQKDFDLALAQTIALDKREKMEGSRVFAFAKQCIANEAYDAAIKGFQYIIEKGKENNLYLMAHLHLLDVKNKKITNSVYTASDLTSLETDYQSFLTEFGKDTRTAFAIRDLANLRALYMNKPAEAIAALEELIEMKGLPADFLAECKISLADIYILTGEMWEAILLYGQVTTTFKDAPLGQEAKFKSARIDYYRGEFEVAKANLDVLKASTSQLVANDALNLSLLIADNTGLDTTTDALAMFAHADLLVYQNRFEEAAQVLDSINILFAGHSLTDEILMAKARMFTKKNLFDDALKAYETVYMSYSQDIWADDALFLSAELYEKKLKRPDQSMKLYEEVLAKYPGSLYIVEARKRFRKLRGDVLN